MEVIEIKRIDINQARLLEELNFQFEYACNSFFINESNSFWSDNYGALMNLPFCETVKQWLMKKGIYIQIDLCCDFKYQMYLKNILDKDCNIISGIPCEQFDSYNDAISKGIDKSLEILKNKQK